MTNKTNTNASSASQFTNEFIVDDEAYSPEPTYTTEGFGGIEPDFRGDTIFVLDIEADSTKQPGTLTGEQCPVSDIENNSYNFLSTQYPHWRRILSDEYMRNTKLNDTNTTSNTTTSPAHKKLKSNHHENNNEESPKTSAQLVMLHIDDHAWASVIHYLTACKFSSQPEVYNSLCLDSGNPTSQWTAAQVKHHAAVKLHLNKDLEKEWQESRKVETWRRALLAKFAQNEDLKRALILTGWAKLVDKHGRVQHLLMWVRTVLRGDQKEVLTIPEVAIPTDTTSTAATTNTVNATTTTDLNKKEDISSTHNPKNVDEVLRVIEGLFGKDKQHILSSILGAQQQQQQKEEEHKKVVEPKVVEMKDAVGYLEQIKTDEPPQTYNKFLEIMTEFRSEKINTPQVLERVTLLFKGKPWLIRNFLMFLPPGHILDLSPENKVNSIYITSPTGKKIVIDTDQGVVTFD